MKIGVTGIYASGKGTVCQIFNDLGAHIIDTDLVARDIVAPGSPVLAKLVNEFGDTMLTQEGLLDREELASVVFKDQDKVQKLNSITHPEILKKVFDEIQKTPENIVMVNTPLLYESGFDKYMDKNIVVTAEINQVIHRGVKRDGLSENQINERLAHQISLNEKIKKADYIIDNSYTMENTKRQVYELWKTLMKITTTE